MYYPSQSTYLYGLIKLSLLQITSGVHRAMHITSFIIIRLGKNITLYCLLAYKTPKLKKQPSSSLPLDCLKVFICLFQCTFTCMRTPTPNNHAPFFCLPILSHTNNQHHIIYIFTNTRRTCLTHLFIIIIFPSYKT